MVSFSCICLTSPRTYIFLLEPPVISTKNKLLIKRSIRYGQEVRLWLARKCRMFYRDCVCRTQIIMLGVIKGEVFLKFFVELLHFHSRHQSLRSFWPAAGISFSDRWSRGTKALGTRMLHFLRHFEWRHTSYAQRLSRTSRFSLVDIVSIPYPNSQLANQKPKYYPDILQYQVTDLISHGNAKFWAELGYNKYLIVMRLAKIRTMARPNSPDIPTKRTKKV